MSSTSTTPSSAADGIGFRSERGPVLGALMLTTGLVALDSTIIATAVPSIVQDLGGFTQFPWLFSIYLLTAGGHRAALRQARRRLRAASR